mgnify:CR=1 FL=1
MKKLLILLIIVVILPMFALYASAEGETEEYISELENILPESLSGITEDTDTMLEHASLPGILSEITSVLSGRGSELLGFFLTLLGIVLLMSVASLLGGQLSRSAEAAVGLICSLMIFPRISSLMSEVSLSLEKINLFFSSLVPITVGITALGGGESSAAVQGSGMYLTLSLLGSIGGQVFVGLSAIGLALSLISPLGGERAASIIRGIKSLFSWLMGIFTAIMTGVFSLQTLIASSADSAAMRAAKYMASGLIPVVGSTVSGALSTLASGLSYAKGIVGGAAIVTLLVLAISPLAVLIAYRLALTLASSVSEAVGSAASRIFSSYRSALDMTLSVYALSVVIYLFEVIIFIRMGVAIL